MKKIVFILLAMLAFASCETSDGVKYGTLQKISHKNFPCTYYEAEIAFEGGRSVASDKSTAFENTQRFEISQAAYDTLQSHVGDKVVFSYKDVGFVACGESKQLVTIQVK